MHDRLLACAAIAGVPLFMAQEAPRAPTRLRCEMLVEPRAVDTTAPRFTWEVVDPRGKAFRLLVAADVAKLDREEGLLWDSGVVEPTATPFVTYAGAPLSSGQIAYWRVRTFDTALRASPWSKTASFRMAPGDAAALATAWIRDATEPPPFTPAHNGFHSSFTSNPDELQWVQIDLGAQHAFDSIRLWPARPFDFEDTPGFLFPLRFRIWVGDDPSFERAYFKVVDRGDHDVPNPGEAPVELTFARASARYVRLGVTKLAKVERGHAFALAEMEVLNAGTSVARGADVRASAFIEEGGWSRAKLVDGDVRSHAGTPIEPLPAPMFRKAFRVDGDVARASLRVSALGLFRFSVNGKRVGADELAPGWTDYHRRVACPTYDVTELLKRGDNAIGAIAGDGWFAGRIGLAGIMPGYPARGIYGRRPCVLAELSIELADGSRTVIATDETWKSTLDGPIRSSDLLDGEVYDARRELPGWDAPGFDDSAWRPVEIAREYAPKRVAELCEPIRVTREVTPIALTEPAPNVFVFDMGQNMVGWCRMRVRGRTGATVALRHGEMLDENGQLYTANLRGAAQTDAFTLRGGGVETLEPHFTYHGFRYVEVTGLDAAPALDDLVGRVVHTAAREVGEFECSEPMLTKLWENIVWTQRANLMSVPTDCPQRDERLGWMGDIQAFAPTASLVMDLGPFFQKWLADVRDAQASDGRFPDFAPHPFGPDQRFSGVPAWGDAGVVVPWSAYQSYGDRRIIEESWDSVTRWIDWIRKENPDLVWRKARNNDYGDWLNGSTLVRDGWSKDGCEVPKDLFATAMFARSTGIAAQMARVLEKSDAERENATLHEGVVAAFRREFLGQDAVLRGDTQAGYALALAFDLLPPEQRERALDRLVRGIQARGGALTTGMMATHFALLELSRRGHHELACAIATRRDFPSWGFAIDNGATTLWERWDGFVPGRGFQDAGMNSFNHWAFGSIGEWLMRMVAGIDPDESKPAWEHVTIRPRPGFITHARGQYDSIRGRIASEWSVEDGELLLDVEIPVGTTATIVMPEKGPGAVTEVGAGRYHFRCELPE